MVVALVVVGIVAYCCGVAATIGFMKRVFDDTFMFGPLSFILPIPWFAFLMMWVYSKASGVPFRKVVD